MADTNDNAIHVFRSFITDRFGLKSIRIADATLLLDSLEMRMVLHGIDSVERYVDNLRVGAFPGTEEEWWAHALTINETYFFRNERDWSAVRNEFLPGLERMHRGHPLQVLSLGCASGEEAWSMAMLVTHDFPRMMDEEHPIIAGDIDLVQLDVGAAGGPYSARSIRLVPPAYRERFLTGGDNRWYVREELKKLVRFRHLNLQRLEALRGRAFDLIFCRNVLIYFEEQAVRAVLHALVRLLSPGGHVILGHSEGMLADMAGLPLRIVDGCLSIPASQVRARHMRSARIERPVSESASMQRDETGTDPARAERGAADAPTAIVAAGVGSEATAAWISVEEMTERARHALHTGAVDEASRQLRLILQRDAHAAEARYLMGMVHLSTGDLMSALTAFERVLHADDTHLMARLQAVVLHGRAGDGRTAARHRARLSELVAARSDDEIIDDEQGITIGFIKLVCTTTTSPLAAS